MSATTYKWTWRNIPEDCNHYQRSCGKVKSHEDVEYDISLVLFCWELLRNFLSDFHISIDHRIFYAEEFKILHCRITTTKSPASGAGNVGEPRLMPQVRVDRCERWTCQYSSAHLAAVIVWLTWVSCKICETRTEGYCAEYWNFVDVILLHISIIIIIII
jgi:hypothetical protein